MVNCNQEKSFHEGENKVIEKKVKKNQSVEKVLQIIELLVSQGGEMRLQDIADQVNSPSSTVLRYLSTLSSFGYVYQNADSSKYALTLKLAQLGSLVSGQYDIRNLVHDDLVALSKKFQESSCLAIEEDHEVVYIDVINGPDNMLKTMQRIGKRAPLHATSVGKNILQNYTEKEIEDILKEKGMPALTAKTLTTPEALFKELETVQETGVAMDNEECEIGAKCISVPLIDYTGKVVAAISISGPVFRMTDEKVERIKEYMLRMSKEISKKLAYTK